MWFNKNHVSFRMDIAVEAIILHASIRGSKNKEGKGM